MAVSRVQLFSAFLVGTALTGGALADEREKRDEPEQHGERPEKREVPDYDGRGGRTTPGEVALWVPRVILSPLYFTSEYIIRRPLGWLISTAEGAQLPAALYDFFTFGPDRNAGFFPTAFFEMNFNPSIGVYAFWDDAGFKGHELRFHASFGGEDWVITSFTERFWLSSQHSVTLKATTLRRPDFTYYGLGPDTLNSDRSRYGTQGYEVRAVSDLKFAGSSAMRAVVGYRDVRFFTGAHASDPTLEDSVAAGTFPMPNGYEEGYDAFFVRGRLALDTRRSLEESQTGLRLHLEGEPGASLGASPPAGFFRYAAAAGGFLDLADRGRVLSVVAGAAFAEPLGSGEVPFTELTTLGGPGLMPGFAAGRMRGESTAVATLRYSWPIWIWLRGSLQSAVGNAFGEHLDGFALKKLRFSGALGLESFGSEDSTFEALLGLGTETFEQGGHVESIRASLGVRGGL